MKTLHPTTIFLADDDADDRMLFEDALGQLEQTVQLTTARNGVELMSILDERVPPEPDVIFLDLNMPGKNGFECLREIKKTEKLKDIPIVIFSTSTQQEAINEVYHDGASCFIRKPETFSQLATAIRTVISRDWRDTDQRSSRDHFFLSF